MSEKKIILKILKLLKLVNLNNIIIIKIALVSFMVGIFEMLSIGLLVPFLKILTNPVEALGNWNILKILDINSQSELISYATIIFVITLILSALLKILLMNLTMNLTFSTGLNLTSKIFRNVVEQNYLYHLENQSSELIDAISMKTNNIVYLAVMSLLGLFSSILIVTLFLTTFFILFTKIAILLSLIILLSYFFAVRLFSEKIKIISKDIAIYSSKSIKILQETLSNIKDIIISKNINYAYELFYHNEKVYKRSQSEHSLITLTPKIIIELLGLLAIVFYAYINSTDNNLIYELIPLLAAIAFAAQKILPLFAQCYIYWSNLKGQEKSIDVVNGYLELNINKIHSPLTKLTFDRSILIEKLTYRYDISTSLNTIENINLTVKKNSKICIFGRSGGGKSTLINLIMGLIFANSGKISIDGIELSPLNASSWHDKISHVPQNVFIADDTIIRNITLSAINEPINISKVNSILEFVGLTDYINSLPLLSDTILGESGAKLSGGQRQRIGIGRALYKDSDLIILDESTNSLDSISEINILKKLVNLENKTIIMITHNHNNAILFDEVINLDLILKN